MEFIFAIRSLQENFAEFIFAFQLFQKIFVEFVFAIDFYLYFFHLLKNCRFFFQMIYSPVFSSIYYIGIINVRSISIFTRNFLLRLVLSRKYSRNLHIFPTSFYQTKLAELNFATFRQNLKNKLRENIFRKNSSFKVQGVAQLFFDIMSGKLKILKSVLMEKKIRLGFYAV